MITRQGPPVIGNSQPKPLHDGEVRCILKLACDGALLEGTRKLGKVCAACMRQRMAKHSPMSTRESVRREGREMFRAPVTSHKRKAGGWR